MNKANNGRLFWGALIRVLIAAVAAVIAATVVQRLLFGQTSRAVTLAVALVAVLGASSFNFINQQKLQ